MDVKLKKQQPLQDDKVRELIKDSQNGNKTARDEIVNKNTRLVWSVVQRFINRGYEAEDLFQIGVIGLIKSIDKFDLSYEVKFSTYAVPMIIGEIQRFIRDDGTVKVSRSLKELNNKIRKKKEELTKKLARVPNLQEISEALEIPMEEIVFATEATRSLSSLHETIYENDGDPITLIDQIADQGDSKWFEQIAIKEVVEQLEERERIIVYLRYYKDQTQSEVAKRLDISQVQVSRLEKRILDKMKSQLSE
ncbi:RNA polymerase sporulation-specific sigma factor [Salibacterium salarium]|uniref:RNA polymerase sporulation sigma factor SigF n=1 Tax=Salibacterium salarium TaxID=284579 RepID=UPI00278102A2|nr:RNA polymerase sporulation sigma factor SigF [Salibacterium salarium]MDQ0299523.1 RNA polymerase sporulation-specific sigma factor [Salibacterium salarium]